MSAGSKVGILLFVVGLIWACLGWISFLGLKVLKPQEALVLTLFGKYVGTLKGEGFYYVNPFCTGVNPAAHTKLGQSGDVDNGSKGGIPGFTMSANGAQVNVAAMEMGKKISLKVMTLSNTKQKINDRLGNPVEDRHGRDVAGSGYRQGGVHRGQLQGVSLSPVRQRRAGYSEDIPYDVAPGIDTTGDGQADEGSLRGSSETVAQRIKDELQAKVANAGIEVLEARITYLAYAPEIAAVMLQRQQASAIVDARKMIVDGAVGMVEMALARLKEGGMVELDEERKAAMVSNLLVVLCGNKDAQPVVNSGSLY